MRAHLTRFAGASLLVAGFGVALTASSCTNPATEVVAGFTTQMRVPDELKAVAVLVTQGGRPILCRAYKVTDGSVDLPSTIGAVPAADRDGVPPEPVRISLLGFRQTPPDTFQEDCLLGLIPNAGEPNEAGEPRDVMMVRRAALAYTKDRILFTPMPLRESCTDVTCDENQSCIGGVCEDAAVDDSRVVEYRDDIAFGNANTCFNPDLCMVGSTLAVMTDKATCTFRLPVPEELEANTPRNPGALNVEVIYNSFGTEILDLDDREGFVFPDENDPWTFRLAENLCKSQFPTAEDPDRPAKILGVYASPLCQAKRALQPICTEALTKIQEGARSPSGSDGDLCPYGQPLQATESLLYVLMDRSASMGEFFGDEGLELAVGVPLDNPVAARTRLAFSFLPADATDCDDGAAYATPMFGFAEPELLRGDIATALGDAGSVLPGPASGDPMIFFDAAMRGAYQALHGINDSQSATFNRKAVVLIGNRDFQTHCAGNMPNTLEQLAATERAAADPIYTYVAVLNGPSDAPNYAGPSPQAAGAAIASSGGTSVFDAVANELEGALAVQKVLNDLGSCLYDPMVIDPRFDIEQITNLSFVNPLTQEATVISRAQACTSPDADVDGFGYDVNGQVVICGEPCATLRQTLTDTASYHALSQQPAPAVPIMPSLSCVQKAQLLEDLYELTNQ